MKDNSHITVNEFINNHQILFRTFNNQRQLIIIDLLDGNIQKYGFDLNIGSMEEFEIFKGTNLDNEIIHFYLEDIKSHYNIIE